jgi:hypothetical protein
MPDSGGAPHNPDVLSCLANLSSDEAFTPPAIVNRMLDSLPQDIFGDEGATFLDPACKFGVFPREIAKRLLKGLEARIPDLRERADHIFAQRVLPSTRMAGIPPPGSGTRRATSSAGRRHTSGAAAGARSAARRRHPTAGRRGPARRRTPMGSCTLKGRRRFLV